MRPTQLEIINHRRQEDCLNKIKDWQRGTNRTAFMESIEKSVRIVSLSSYLWSVLCKYPNKLLRVGLAAFGQEPRTQNLCPLSHLQGRSSSVTQKQQNTRRRGVEGLKSLCKKSFHLSTIRPPCRGSTRTAAPASWSPDMGCLLRETQVSSHWGNIQSDVSCKNPFSVQDQVIVAESEEEVTPHRSTSAAVTTILSLHLPLAHLPSLHPAAVVWRCDSDTPPTSCLSLPL